MENLHEIPGGIPVTLNDGEEAMVTIEGPNGGVIVLHDKHCHYNHAFVALLNDARGGRLPRWAEQVPPLVKRIEAIFTKERAEGKDPHYQVGISGDDAFYLDLRRQTRIAQPLRDLKADLARGKQLPKIYDTPEVRAALGITA